MVYRAALSFSALAGLLAAQSGTAPKASAQDYPVHAKLEKLSIGAEYLVHSFSRGRETVSYTHLHSIASVLQKMSMPALAAHTCA